ncbi:10866_t:CDS:2, partial [Dentiscutata heterogama]
MSNQLTITKRMCTAISDSLKYEICKYHLKYSTHTQSQIALYFNTQDSKKKLDHSTISKILKDKDQWLAKTEAEISDTVFKHKKTKFPQLDHAIQLWVKSIIYERLFLTEAIIKEKAIYFAHALSLLENVLKFSNSWINKFKKRNHLQNFRLHSEAESAPIESLPEFRQELWEIIQEYTLDNVYNANETSLFYRLAPYQTLASKPCSGWKKVSNIPSNTQDTSDDEESTN